MSQIDDQVNDIVARSEAVAAELAAFANSALNIVIPDANTAIPGVFETILVGSDNANNIGSQTDGVLKVITDQTTSYADNPIFANYSGTGSGGGVISVRKARGSQANPQSLEDGDIVGGIYAAGYDGTTFNFTSALRFKVDGVVNAAAALETPMKVVIETKDETGVTGERLVVKPDGSVNINGEPDANSTLSGEYLTIKPSLRIWNSTGGSGLYLEDASLQTTQLFQLNTDDAFAIYRNGSEKMRIDNSGNVGINTSSNPSSALEIVASSSDASALGVTIRNTDSTNDFQFELGVGYPGYYDDSAIIRHNDNLVAYITSSGDWQYLQRVSMASDKPIQSLTNGFAQLNLYDGNGNTKLGSFADIIFLNQATEAMRINSTGFVGIGTSDPTKLLTLEDDGPVQIRLQQQNDVNEWFQIAQNGSNQVAFKSSANGVFGEYLFVSEDGTSSATRMVIKSDGNVGIATADPRAALDIDLGASVGTVIPFQFDCNVQTYPTPGFGGALTFNHGAGPGRVNIWNTWSTAGAQQGGFDFKKLTGASSADTLMAINGDGKLLGGARPLCELTLASDQSLASVASGSTYVVDWTSQTTVDTNYFTHSTGTNPSRITVSQTGRYHIRAYASFVNATVTSNRMTFHAYARVNGTTTYQIGSIFGYTRGDIYGGGTAGFDWELDLSALDYVEIIVRCDDADATYTGTLVSTYTGLQIRRVE